MKKLTFTRSAMFQTLCEPQILLVLSLLTILFGFGSCAQFIQSFGPPVTVTRKDTSPPTVTLIIPDLGNGQIILHPGDKTKTIHMSSIKPYGQIFVIASAEDPQGVQSVCIQPDEFVECSLAGQGFNQSFPLPPPTCSGYDRQVKTATTKLWVPFLVDPRQHQCEVYGAGYEGTVRLLLYASAKNFSGQEVTANVRFVSP
jgi:hypothetical protein